jgi:hypothetical protein
MFYFGSGKEKSPSPLNFDEIIARAPHLDLDVSVPGVLPDRRLHMTRLTIIDAFNVVRLEYEIIPLNEPPSPESAEVSRAYGPWGWMVGGRDDRGTVYDDHGGTYGVPPNGLVADGDRDLFPTPPSDATWLEITINVGAPDVSDPVYTLKIDLPLRPPSADR